MPFEFIIIISYAFSLFNHQNQYSLTYSQRLMINYVSLLLLFYQKIISVWFMCKNLKINAIYKLENVLCLSERSYDQAECMFNFIFFIFVPHIAKIRKFNFDENVRGITNTDIHDIDGEILSVPLFLYHKSRWGGNYSGAEAHLWPACAFMQAEAFEAISDWITLRDALNQLGLWMPLFSFILLLELYLWILIHLWIFQYPLGLSFVLF